MSDSKAEKEIIKFLDFVEDVDRREKSLYEWHQPKNIEQEFD